MFFCVVSCGNVSVKYSKYKQAPLNRLFLSCFAVQVLRYYTRYKLHTVVVIVIQGSSVENDLFFSLCCTWYLVALKEPRRHFTRRLCPAMRWVKTKIRVPAVFFIIYFFCKLSHQSDHHSFKSSTILLFFSISSSSGKIMLNLTIKSPLAPLASLKTGIPLSVTTLEVWGLIISSKWSWTVYPPSSV